MIFFYQFLFLVLTYLICSIPFGLIVTRLALGKDIRESGSGNIGATNVTRVAGKKLGAITLLLDGFKGMVMVIAARFTFYSIDNLHLLLIAVSAIAVVGHIYPIYLRFKGGKGVATTIAVLFALDPTIGFLTVMFWVMSFLLFRISAVASLVAILSASMFSVHYDAPREQVWLYVFLFILVTIRHKENIMRLLLGEEKKM